MFKFTVDDWLNRYLWPSQVHRFPAPLRRLLGGGPTIPRPDHWVWTEALVASFCGIALIEAVFKSHTAFSAHSPPLILASYGATAILCFNALSLPLAQPRNVLMGHFVSALIGLCIQKLFSLSAAGQANYWAAGALSVGLLLVAMLILNCVHPPGGALALLPSVDDSVRDLSWWYLPIQLVSSVLTVAVACLFGNIVRSYPVYWWSAGAMGRPKSTHASGLDEAKDLLLLVSTPRENPKILYAEGTSTVEITPLAIIVPADLPMELVEAEWLETIRLLLARQHPVEKTTDTQLV